MKTYCHLPCSSLSKSMVFSLTIIEITDRSHNTIFKILKPQLTSLDFDSGSREWIVFQAGQVTQYAIVRVASYSSCRDLAVPRLLLSRQSQQFVKHFKTLIASLAHTGRF